jgi:DNA-directed RNA polymerase
MGYKTNEWSAELRLQAGNWALCWLLQILPDVFTLVEDWQEKFVSITEAAQGYIDQVVADIVSRNPVWLPLPKPPRMWTGWNEGGTWDKRLAWSFSLIRTRHKQTKPAVQKAIRDGSMKPALDALNSLQAVPWKINERLLAAIRECASRGIEVPGLPAADLALPEKPRSWDSMDDDAQLLWKQQRDAVARANRKSSSQRTLFAEDIQTAEALSKQGRFWTPMNLDWRGRVYAAPSFNYQREDHIRALFLFADGEPIGEEGIYWLKVHTANCGDFQRISKRPFAERVKWVDDNLTLLDGYSTAPLTNSGWTKADKLFLFLAACMELSSALKTGPSYVSCIPVSFDGSCSGLQHLCAMTRAPEGSLVNLTPQELPQDVYQAVADLVKERIEKDEHGDNKDLRQRCLDYGITRKLVKRNVMTYFYGSKAYGMARQQDEDLRRPLIREELKGGQHPFGLDGGYAASRYLAKHIYTAIGEVVDLPAQAMTFLQRLARAATSRGQPLRWVSPAGVPCSNRYHKPNSKQVTL